MKKIITICALGLLVGCQSTLQDLNNKYLTQNQHKQTTVPDEKPKNLKHKLFVNTTPADAKIYITNIKPKFKQGIELPNGEYKIKVKKQGYETVLKTVHFSSNDTNETLNITLKEDALAFKSDKVTKQSGKDRYGRNLLHIFPKRSAALALASLIEFNNGQTKFPYYNYLGNKVTFDVESDLFDSTISNLEKNLNYKKHYNAAKTFEADVNQKLHSLRPSTKKYLDREYIVTVPISMREEDLASAFDDEDETLSLNLKWYQNFASENDDYYSKAGLRQAIGKKSDDYVYGGLGREISYSGLMTERKIIVENVTLESLQKLWKAMPNDRTKHYRKLLHVDLLLQITSTKVDISRGVYEIDFVFEPSQFRIKGLNVLQKI